MLKKNELNLAYLASVFLFVLANIFTLQDGHNWGDDASQYLLHAQNLAQGRDYNHGLLLDAWISAPWGFPLLLLPVVKFFGINFVLLKAGNIFWWFMYVHFLFLIAQKQLGQRQALWLALLLLSCFFLFSFKQNILSEWPFMAFMMAGVYAFSRYTEAQAWGRKSAVCLGLALALMTVAYFIRVVGGVLFVAAIFYQLVIFSNSFAEVAAGNSNQFETLQNQLTELRQVLAQQQKIIAKQGQELESLKLKLEPREKPVYVTSPAGSAAALPAWADGLKMGGDFRLRYEGINESNEANRDRNRFRFRLRYGIEKQLNQDFIFGFRLATGTATDPTTPNQTLTGDFTPKNIFIDRAYVKYQPGFLKEKVPHLKSTEIGAGKVANPYLDSSGIMLWDPDVNPEGIYESAETSFYGGRFRPFAILGQFVVNENAAATDAEMFAYQGGYRLELSSDVKKPLTWTSALAFYDYSDVTNSSNFTVSGTSLAGGNTTLGSTDLAAGDFKVLNIYQDLKFGLASLPVKLFGEYDQNLTDHTFDPVRRNHAYQYGLVLGNAKAKGDWQVNWYYAYIEPNALYAAFTESDFGGGHVNQMGNNFETYYMLTNFMKLRFKASFTNNVLGTDDETRRFQTDLEWKF